MSREITDKCDGCGAIKGATNHWWMILNRLIRASADSPPQAGISIIHWDERFISDSRQFCGQACIQKAVSEFMGAK